MEKLRTQSPIDTKLEANNTSNEIEAAETAKANQGNTKGNIAANITRATEEVVTEEKQKKQQMSLKVGLIRSIKIQ